MKKSYILPFNCARCNTSEFRRKEVTNHADGTLVIKMICKKCGKYKTIPLSQLPAAYIDKARICPNCDQWDKVVRKTATGSDNKRFHCERCNFIYQYPYYWNKNFHHCPHCGLNIHVRRLKSKHDNLYYYCSYCKKKFYVARKKTTHLIQKTCTRCGSRNTIFHGFTKGGKPQHYCKMCKKRFYLDRMSCWRCDSKKLIVLINKKEIRLFYCRKCQAILKYLNETDLAKYENIITPIPEHRKKIMFLENQISDLKATLNLYEQYITETGLIKNLELWNKSTKNKIDNNNYHDLRIDIFQSKLQLTCGQIFAIIVSCHEGILIFKDQSEAKVLRSFCRFLNSLPYFIIFVYNLRLREILQARASLYKINLPNLTRKTRKFGGIYDLKEEIDSPKSAFNSKLNKMIDSLDLIPLPNLDSVPEDKKKIAELSAKWNQIKSKGYYQLGKSQIKDLFDNSKDGKFNLLLTSKIRMVDAIYYSMEWTDAEN